jgi:Fur family ferric uptake transcriptional regulator
MDSRGLDLISKVVQSDLKLTRQRKLIIEKMQDFQVPFGAEDLYSSGLQEKGIDLATIYRTLNLFFERNWLSKIDLEDGCSRYIFKKSESHHHTLLCRSCHKVEHLPGCFVEQQQKELLKKGFTSLSHRVEFVGLCPACSKNSSQASAPGGSL